MSIELLFAVVGQCSFHRVETHISQDTYNIDEVRVERCPNCGQPAQAHHHHGRTRKGSGYVDTLDCKACGFAEGDGDYEPDEEAAYEDYCDSMARMATDPRQEYYDSLCHRCEETPAEPGSITCWECSVELYGEEQAAYMRKQRESRLNPPLYAPINDNTGREYEPNREALAMEARAELEGRWGDE